MSSRAVALLNSRSDKTDAPCSEFIDQCYPYGVSDCLFDWNL
jgi:hypothetical protein